MLAQRGKGICRPGGALDAHLFGEHGLSDLACHGCLSAIPSQLAQVACSLRDCVMSFRCNLLRKRSLSQKEESGKPGEDEEGEDREP